MMMPYRLFPKMRVTKFPTLLALCLLFGLTISDRVSLAQSPRVYVVASPPTSQIGLVLNGRYYTFGREPPEVKCDLRYEGGCYWRSTAKVKQVSKDIISINGGRAFGCSPSIIPDMSNVPGYESGYGECTSKGWVSMRNK